MTAVMLMLLPQQTLLVHWVNAVVSADFGAFHGYI
jgi:hypothetical protein